MTPARAAGSKGAAQRVARVRRTLATLGVIVALGTFAIAMSFRSSTRVLTPGAVPAGGAREGAVEVTGVVVAGSLRRLGDATEFSLAGAGRSIRVRFAGAAPDTLTPGRRVTVVGRYGRAGLIARADALRVSCQGEQHC